MPPPSKDTVVRAYFTEGLNLAPGLVCNSRDAENDKCALELHPAGVRIMGSVNAAPYHVIVPWARIKSINLA